MKLFVQREKNRRYLTKSLSHLILFPNFVTRTRPRFIKSIFFFFFNFSCVSKRCYKLTQLELFVFIRFASVIAVKKSISKSQNVMYAIELIAWYTFICTLYIHIKRSYSRIKLISIHTYLYSTSVYNYRISFLWQNRCRLIFFCEILQRVQNFSLFDLSFNIVLYCHIYTHIYCIWTE